MNTIANQPASPSIDSCYNTSSTAVLQSFGLAFLLAYPLVAASWMRKVGGGR
jgi:hypothetical protein